MSLAKKIAINVVINTFAKVSSIALAFVGIGMAMRYLGEHGFGQYSLAVTFFALLSAFGDWGLYSIATREISRKGANESRILSQVLLIRLVVSSTLVGLLLVILPLLPYTQELKWAIVMAGGAFFLSSTYGLFNGLFQKHLIMHRVALVELMGKAIQVAVMAYAVVFDAGFLVIVSSLLFQILFNFVGISLLLRSRFQPSLRPDTAFMKQFIRESMPLGVVAIITFFYLKFDTILLSLPILGGSEGYVGIYNGAYKVIENIVFFPAMIIGLVVPLFSRTIFDNKKRFVQFANKTFKVFVVLAFPLLIVLLVFADDIIYLLSQGGFEDSSVVLQILAFSLVSMFFGQFFNALLLVGNLQRKIVQILAVCALLSVGANILLIPHFAYFASASISAITELLVVVAGAYLVWKHLKYIPRVDEWRSVGLSVLLFTGCVVGLQDITHFLIVIIGCGLVYIFLLLYTKAITREEIQALFSSNKTADSPEESV